MAKNKKRRKLISYDVIKVAITNDAEAIYVVLKYYEPYINKLSLLEYYDFYGNKIVALDEDIKQMLQIKLVMKIIDFKIQAVRQNQT